MLAPERLGRAEAVGLTALATFATCAHFSNLPLALALLACLLPLRLRLGARAALGGAGLARVVGAPVAAALALTAVNLAGHGTAAIAPYGNVFLLARLIEDGPGRDALIRACPGAGWRLCAARDLLPANADAFLWRPDSPLEAAGGPKRVSAEADAIIAAAIRAEPGRELAAMLRNAGRQLLRFGSGDGLQPWPETVTPWINRDFPPFEQVAYAASRQANGRSLLPDWMGRLHEGAALGGPLSCWPAFPDGCADATSWPVSQSRSWPGSSPTRRSPARCPGRMTATRAGSCGCPASPFCSAPAGAGRGGVSRMRGVAWSGIEAAASGAFSLVSAFVVARLIGPAEMGVGAAVASVHVLLWVGVNALFADAVVQRLELSESDASSALWASTLVGLTAALAQASAGWPLRTVMGDSRIGAMTLVLALPLVGAAGVVQGRVNRARDYRLLALRALLGQGAGTVAGIATALQGGGAWAVVAQ